MKIRLIVDDAKGPDGNGGEVSYPRGHEIEHKDAWMHCLPNGDFDVITDTKTGKKEYRSAGRILAEPADEECEKRVELEAEKRKRR